MKKHKTNTFDMFNSVFACLVGFPPGDVTKTLSIQEIHEITGLDRMAIKRTLEIMVHLCVAHYVYVGNRKKYRLYNHILVEVKKRSVEYISELIKEI